MNFVKPNLTQNSMDGKSSWYMSISFSLDNGKHTKEANPINLI